jgi:hypothetical protein
MVEKSTLKAMMTMMQLCKTSLMQREDQIWFQWMKTARQMMTDDAGDDDDGTGLADKSVAGEKVTETILHRRHLAIKESHHLVWLLSNWVFAYDSSE